MQPETVSLSSDEKKIIFNAIRYYQMFKASYEGKDYKLCQDLLNKFYGESNSQKN